MTISPSERVDYSPIVERPQIRWPNDARVALWVVPNIEHYEYLPPPNVLRDPWPRVPHPDVQQYSYRDYGNRVGLWRMADMCEEYGVRCTVSLNLAVLDHYEQIADLIRARDWCVMSHGIYNTRYVYELSEEEEREWLRDNVETLRRHTGWGLKGMLGPAISGTARTPDLMVEAGLVYHADWIHDDEPVPINVESGRLISIPYSYELNDAPLFAKHYGGDYFAQICKEQFDVLYKEGETSGRVMCIALHPFLIGQPHMIDYLREVFEYLSRYDDVWWTTGDAIAEHYLEHHYDEAIAHARALTEE
jgi:peptidoglycan/xylan/chitin deacetylase (PgdA/CDA1 family)